VICSWFYFKRRGSRGLDLDERSDFHNMGRDWAGSSPSRLLERSDFRIQIRKLRSLQPWNDPNGDAGRRSIAGGHSNFTKSVCVGWGPKKDFFINPRPAPGSKSANYGTQACLLT
jgi:hypothetical protein